MEGEAAAPQFVQAAAWAGAAPREEFFMTPQRIILIQGHPDASAPHLCHALADAYAKGAAGAGHEVAPALPVATRRPPAAKQTAERAASEVLRQIRAARRRLNTNGGFAA